MGIKLELTVCKHCWGGSCEWGKTGEKPTGAAENPRFGLFQEPRLLCTLPIKEQSTCDGAEMETVTYAPNMIGSVMT